LGGSYEKEMEGSQAAILVSLYVLIFLLRGEHNESIKMFGMSFMIRVDLLQLGMLAFI
jgi:hypothetical protein